MSDLVGQTVGNYQVRALIGSGGMGTVYLGEHVSLPRRAAIKVLRREFGTDPIVLRRFLEEARAAAAVVHPNIVDVQDVGTLPDGLPFMIMEFLAGESLGRRLARVGRLPVPAALTLLLQAAAGLQAVHDKGIVHRDLKPDNLFITPDPHHGDGERVKILDFGIAKLRGDAKVSGLNTRSGSLLGTPLYMSPEQCRGSSDTIDQRTDVYALGIILYEMICGAPPFRAEGFGDLLILHVSAPPPRPSRVVPDVPAHVEAAILRCLAKDPALRFASMDQLRAALAPDGPGTLLVPRPAGLSTTASSRRTRVLPDEEPHRTITTLSGAAAAATIVDRPRRGRLAGAVALAGAALAGGFLFAQRLTAPPAAPPAPPADPRPIPAFLPPAPPVVDAAPALAGTPDAAAAPAAQADPPPRPRPRPRPRPVEPSLVPVPKAEKW